MRVLVCGGRRFVDVTLLTAKLDELHAQLRFSVLIEGDAIGADRLAGEWANSRGIEHIKFIADWEGQGSKAGPKRNQRMLIEGKPELVIAFPGEHGTAHMVRIARAAAVKVIEIGSIGRQAPGQIELHAANTTMSDGRQAVLPFVACRQSYGVATMHRTRGVLITLLRQLYSLDTPAFKTLRLRQEFVGLRNEAEAFRAF